MVGKSRIDIIGQNGNTGEHYEDTHWTEQEVEMERYSGYNAKFWIFEEQRYGTWEESQEFYSRQAEEEKRIRARSFANSLSTEELAAVRDRLVAEG
tara:strand:- start:680 stop:967 length:288 start_codon:yes stop_codon:yes gene_type:complete